MSDRSWFQPGDWYRYTVIFVVGGLVVGLVMILGIPKSGGKHSLRDSVPSSSHSSESTTTTPVAPSTATRPVAPSSPPTTSSSTMTATQLSTALSKFKKTIRALDTEGLLFKNVSADDMRVTITLGDFWYTTPDYKKERLASMLWNLWADACQPRSPDYARVRLVDEFGKELARSNWLDVSNVEIKR